MIALIQRVTTASVDVDGATVARVLARLEEVLNTAVRDELLGQLTSGRRAG